VCRKKTKWALMCRNIVREAKIIMGLYLKDISLIHGDFWPIRLETKFGSAAVSASSKYFLIV